MNPEPLNGCYYFAAKTLIRKEVSDEEIICNLDCICLHDGSIHDGRSLCGPGMATQTYSFYVYLTGLRNFNIGYASALAYILLAIMLPISLFLFRQLRQIYD